MSTDITDYRHLLSQAERVVVKLGTGVLVDRSGRPQMRRMQSLVKEIARLRKDGRQVIVVSSGAIGTGVEALGWKRRPKDLPSLQMAASVGQSRLMTRYEQCFAKERLKVAQLLLTHDDLKNRVRHLNVRNTLMSLLREGVVPIVNENDVVSVDAIKIGDNDQLAALLAMLIGAEALLLMSTTDGLREPQKSGRTRRIPYLGSVSNDTLSLVTGKTGEFSVGGMQAKLGAAQMVVKAGGLVLIADGRKPENISRAFRGEEVGTLIGSPRADGNRIVQDRKRWIAFFHKVQGTILIDDGAKDALEKRGNSLLPIGIRKVEGKFPIGSLVNVKDSRGRLVARGLVEYPSDEIQKIKGHKTSEIVRILGSKDYDEVIHRDNMVVLGHDGEVS